MKGRRQRSSITKKIKEAVIDFDTIPSEINLGQCRDFAERVQGTSRKKGIKLLSHIDELNSANNHCFIRYKKRYYDAEAPRGVSSPSKLPFFKSRKIVPKPRATR